MTQLTNREGKRVTRENMRNFLLAGVGGQGTVLASKLLAQAGMDDGLFARTAETIGMAQRGGSVVSHVRIGETVYSPLIPKGAADVIIGFEPAEAVRVLDYLKTGGTVVANRKAIKPTTDFLAEVSYTPEPMFEYLQKHAGQVLLVDGDAVCEACGSTKVLNIVLLGAAAGAGLLGISLEALDRVISEKIPERFRELNRKALRMGAECIQ